MGLVDSSVNKTTLISSDISPELKLDTAKTGGLTIIV